MVKVLGSEPNRLAHLPVSAATMEQLHAEQHGRETGKLARKRVGAAITLNEVHVPIRPILRNSHPDGGCGVFVVPRQRVDEMIRRDSRWLVYS